MTLPRRPPRDDRGVNDSVQWAVVLPAVMLCVLGLLQAGLWVHGRTTVRHAAAAAAEAEAGEHPVASGRQVAEEIADAGGLEAVDVRLEAGAETVRVEVSARVPVFFDLGQGRVSAVSIHPRERVTR